MWGYRCYNWNEKYTYFYLDAQCIGSDNSFPTTNASETAILKCPDEENYKGSRTRRCSEKNYPPEWESTIDNCGKIFLNSIVLKSPKSVSYNPPEATFSFGIFDMVNVTIEPKESLEEYKFSISEDTTELPRGLIIDESNGTISGILEEGIFEGSVHRLSINVTGERIVLTSFIVRAKGKRKYL